MKKKLPFALFLLGLASQTLSAQDKETYTYDSYPYAFISLQGGMQTVPTNYTTRKLCTPISAFSVGGMFTPVIGTRLNVNGWKTKGGLNSLHHTYDYKYINTNLDLMVNFTNIVMPQKDRQYPLNVYLLGGFGLTYAWDNDDFNALSPQAQENNLYYAWKDNRLVHNFRIGLQLEANLTRNISINLEATGNHVDDRFNSKTNKKGDWQIQALAGITFKFGHKKHKVVSTAPQEEYAEKQETTEPVPAAPAVPVQEEQPVAQPVSTNLNVHFKINEYQLDSQDKATLKELGEWVKSHPDTQIDIKGYADAQTGTPEINRKISEKRTTSVYNYLVEQCGVDGKSITKNHYGDSVQPFSKNSQNRVVIIVASSDNR